MGYGRSPTAAVPSFAPPYPTAVSPHTSINHAGVSPVHNVRGGFAAIRGALPPPLHAILVLSHGTNPSQHLGLSIAPLPPWFRCPSPGAWRPAIVVRLGAWAPDGLPHRPPRWMLAAPRYASRRARTGCNPHAAPSRRPAGPWADRPGETHVLSATHCGRRIGAGREPHTPLQLATAAAPGLDRPLLPPAATYACGPPYRT